MRSPLFLVAIALTAAPLDAQIVGQTCGPNGCNPVFAPPAPAPTPMVTNVSGWCGELVVDVYFLNDESVPLPNDAPLLDTGLRANGRMLHPELRTAAPGRTIAPGAFAGPIRYTAAIPKDLSGIATFQLGPLPPVEFTVDTIPCPAPDAPLSPSR